MPMEYRDEALDVLDDWLDMIFVGEVTAKSWVDKDRVSISDSTVETHPGMRVGSRRSGRIHRQV